MFSFHIDDDCDGQVDEDMATMTCGVGECAASTPSCAGGALQQCTPGAPSAEQCDGLDNNCDGIIDEGCGCVHVSPGGDDGNTGGEGDPMLTIGAAIAYAQANGVNVVCVAAQASCNWTIYDESVVMADGISVYGGFDQNTSPWTQQTGTCVTEIRGLTATGLLFDVSVVNPTILDNFALSGPGEAWGSLDSAGRRSDTRRRVRAVEAFNIESGGS